MEVEEMVVEVEVEMGEVKTDGNSGGGDVGDAGGCCYLLLLLILSFLPFFLFRMGFHIACVSVELTV